MRLQTIYLFFLLILGTPVFSQNTVTIGLENTNESPPYKITGTVYDAASGQAIPNANIYIPRQEIGTISDVEGRFELTLYEGAYQIQVSNVGYETNIKTISVKGSGYINFSLSETAEQLKEVVISGGSADRNVTSKDIGKEVMTIESIKDIPPIGGETDVLKSLTLLPGVSTVGEASSGFNVRGGGSDQNLILLGGATIYNPSHLFGVFTAVNSSVVREVALYKGFVPAEFGGRGSSVVDVKYKKGNFNNWTGEATIGFVTSKFSAGGPVVKDKLSAIVAGRAAYPNWLISKTNDPNVKNSTASFYDVNGIVNYIINEKNDLEYSFYHSSDDFQFADNVAIAWQNT
ncbi:MAG: carboxypeptidase-like regulatory domain-containing protein, partial [Fulvivirga sp.]|nr:carboxypeptidase-like regulatory domain-containing protein [Fulvivirga sp.]